MTTALAILGIGRRTAYYAACARPTDRYRPAADVTALQQIHAVTKPSHVRQPGVWAR